MVLEYLVKRWDQRLSELEKEKKGYDEKFLLELDWLVHLTPLVLSLNNTSSPQDTLANLYYVGSTQIVLPTLLMK